MSAPTALYRLFGDEDALLYVGISKFFGPRWHQHAHAQPWWPEVRRQTIEWHETREAAKAAEDAAIETEHPKYNKHHARLGVTPRKPSQREYGPFNVAFGAKARSLRIVRGLTQGQVAAAMTACGNPWHQSTVHRVESGRQPSLLCEVPDLAGVFGVPWDSLCPDGASAEGLAALLGLPLGHVPDLPPEVIAALGPKSPAARKRSAA